MREKNQQPEFWVTNISTQRDVALGDLRVTVRRCKTINLLSKHYHFTLEQLEASAATGSINKKSSVIKVRRVAPKLMGKMFREVEKRRVLKPVRNAVKLIEKKFDELDLPDSPTNFEENAEAAAIDHRPLLAVDKKYFKDDNEPAPTEDLADDSDELMEGSNQNEEEDDY